MVDRYRYSNIHRNVEKAPNSLFKLSIDENLLEKAKNRLDLRMRLRRILLNSSAEMNLSHQTSKVSKHAMRSYVSFRKVYTI